MEINKRQIDYTELLAKYKPGCAATYFSEMEALAEQAPSITDCFYHANNGEVMLWVLGHLKSLFTFLGVEKPDDDVVDECIKLIVHKHGAITLAEFAQFIGLYKSGQYGKSFNKFDFPKFLAALNDYRYDCKKRREEYDAMSFGETRKSSQIDESAKEEINRIRESYQNRNWSMEDKMSYVNYARFPGYQAMDQMNIDTLLVLDSTLTGPFTQSDLDLQAVLSKLRSTGLMGRKFEYIMEKLVSEWDNELKHDFNLGMQRMQELIETTPENL